MSKLGDELALIGLAKRLDDIETRIKNLEDANISEQQVLEALAEIKSKSTHTFIAPTHGVPLSAIEQVEKRYKGE